VGKQTHLGKLVCGMLKLKLEKFACHSSAVTKVKITRVRVNPQATLHNAPLSHTWPLFHAGAAVELFQNGAQSQNVKALTARTT